MDLNSYLYSKVEPFSHDSRRLNNRITCNFISLSSSNWQEQHHWRVRSDHVTVHRYSQTCSKFYQGQRLLSHIVAMPTITTISEASCIVQPTQRLTNSAALFSKPTDFFRSQQFHFFGDEVRKHLQHINRTLTPVQPTDLMQNLAWQNYAETLWFT